MIASPCVVCGAPAEQKHHISYDPEIEVPICVQCHLKTHAMERGVGPPRREWKALQKRFLEKFQKTKSCWVWTAGKSIPNLALMKLSAHHKALGDRVFLNKCSDPDITFVSCVFTWNRGKYTRSKTVEALAV